MAERPNVLWVSLESVRADHTPLYGYERNTTPNLRALSQRDDATVLRNGVAASNWTRPSTASMMTGTHYSTHNTGGRGAAGTRLPDSLDTLPGLLSDAGYHTALFSTGRQIGPDTGLDRGFDHYSEIGMELSNFSPAGDSTLDSWRCAVESFLERPTLDPRELAKDVRNNNDYLLRRKVERWAKRTAPQNQPFFAYTHIWAPHQLFLPVRRFLHSFEDEIEMGVEAAYELAENGYADLTSKIAHGTSFSDREWEGVKAMYDSEILYADYILDKLVTATEQASDRDLVVVVTADHGELFGEQGIISHKIVLDDGVIRVPMVVLGIEDVVDGPAQVTQHIDLSTTVAELTGVRTEQFEGRDIRASQRKYGISQRREWEFSDYTAVNPEFDHSRYFKDPYTAVRTASHKYLESESRQELYELPDEETDVIESHPELADDLSQVIEEEGIEWFEPSDDDEATFSDATREHLRELGYLS
jgi:uncharacterized sulfatase